MVEKEEVIPRSPLKRCWMESSLSRSVAQLTSCMSLFCSSDMSVSVMVALVVIVVVVIVAAAAYGETEAEEEVEADGEKRSLTATAGLLLVCLFSSSRLVVAGAMSKQCSSITTSAANFEEEI